MCYNKGKVLIISAPSGSGKTTIAKFLISKDLNLVFSDFNTALEYRLTTNK